MPKANDTASAPATTQTPATAPVSNVTPPPVAKPKVESEKRSKQNLQLQPKSASEAPTHSGTAEAGIYVQVGAVATAPEQRVLNDIKAKGFEYRLYSTVVNGNKVTKILIGPYAKSSDAESALVLIRSSINKNAFIYRVK